MASISCRTPHGERKPTGEAAPTPPHGPALLVCPARATFGRGRAPEGGHLIHGVSVPTMLALTVLSLEAAGRGPAGTFGYARSAADVVGNRGRERWSLFR